MTDIVELLRNGYVATNFAHLKAADEIERNRAAIAELVAALRAIVTLDDGDNPDIWHFETEFEAARAVLANHTPTTTTKGSN